MKSIFKFTFLATALIAGAAQAAYITGVTATSSMPDYDHPVSPISRITDGSGLSALSFSATHNALANNIWFANATSGTITFDLHGSYALTDLAVWTFQNNTSLGIQNVSISTSTDNINFFALPGGPSQFAQSSGSDPQSSEVFSIGPVTAAYVKFTVSSVWGGSLLGLDEVGFATTDAPPLPEPASLALFGIGAAAFFARRRRA